MRTRGRMDRAKDSGDHDVRRDILEMEIGIRQPPTDAPQPEEGNMSKRFERDIAKTLRAIAALQKTIEIMDRDRATAARRLQEHRDKLVALQSDTPISSASGKISSRESTSDIMRRRYGNKQQRPGIVGDAEKK